MGLDQYITIYNEKGEIYKSTLRKLNFLRNWMIKNTSLNPKDNCREIPLSLENLTQLREDCDYVLHHEEEASDVLPTLEGFFFGCTAYDSWYFEDVRDLRQILDEMLSTDVTHATYSDWW